jgi:hypothetical protein
MTIVYDAEAKRATHMESGLSVQFLRRGRRFQDQDVYFAVTWKGRTTEFEATVSSGYGRILAKYPGLDSDALSQKVEELNEMEYRAHNIGIDVREALHEDMNFGQMFVDTWWAVVNGKSDSSSSKLVVFKPFFNPVDGYWECCR